MDLKVFIKETTCLKPSKLSDDQYSERSQTIELSGLDRISPAILNTVFFFKNTKEESVDVDDDDDGDDDDDDGDDVVERVIRGLQRVLVTWFPAAGRLGIHEKTGKLEIKCNDEGVLLVIADTFSKLEEFGNKLHEYKTCYEKLVPQLPQNPAHISDNPLVALQITKFSCGGISIGFGGSHSLFDGFGAFNFLASWAHFSSDKDYESQLFVPNHSRQKLLNAIMTTSSTATSSSSLINKAAGSTSSIYEQQHIAAIQDLYGIPMRAMAADDRCWESELAKLGQSPERRGIQLLTLCMDKQAVENWKGLAAQSGTLSKCSTFDVLCAHVWKARVKALSLEPNTNICLQFPVNCRNRLRPPLGGDFTGNAFVLGSVSCTAKELLEEPLEGTIGRIQAAKEVVANDYIKLYVKALENSSDKFFPSMRELTIITDWLKFPFEALDFGWRNKMLCGVALLGTPVPEAAFLMPNLDEPGNFLVRIGIGEENMTDFITNFKSFNYP
ncbi:brassinosteroid-related acyltransferase 1-like [Humulus lupulus]|uniref:brassinosteroid-related acyltransferase 1-like n=1 Tax=Humulus lupulus TaxID=3486 RepID=UPI002B405293|nr:brassinosteroid-related acyltransferase 1-like [Humulus lupulus]